MMDKVEIKSYLDRYKTKAYILLISIMVILLFFSYAKSCKVSDMNSTIIEPKVDDSYKFNIKMDISRLECIFEQRRCYYNNLGIKKELVIGNCNDIDYCESKYSFEKIK
jgi:hypothetical protein